MDVTSLLTCLVLAKKAVAPVAAVNSAQVHALILAMATMAMAAAETATKRLFTFKKAPHEGLFCA